MDIDIDGLMVRLTNKKDEFGKQTVPTEKVHKKATCGSHLVPQFECILQ